MSYFFNVLLGDYDNLKMNRYVDSNLKPSVDEKLNLIKNVIGDSEEIKLRTFDIDDLYTHNTEASYYILTNVKKLDLKEDELHIDTLPLNVTLRNLILTRDSLHIIFLKNEFSDLTLDDINLFCEKSKINFDRIHLINESQFNLEYVKNLSLKKIKNTFNVVYDTWESDYKSFKPNLSNYSKRGEKYRIIEGLFRFYGYYNNIRNCHINEIKINKNENFYYFINSDIMHDEFKKSFDVPLYLKEVHKKYKNFNIVLLNEHEFETKEFIKLLDHYLKLDDIDTSRIYLWNNNSKLNEYKLDIGTEINVYSLEFLVKFISDHIVNFQIQPEFKENKSGSFFLCHNRGPKPHRYALLSMLKKNNILENVDWSLILGWYKKEMWFGNNSRAFYNSVFDENDYKEHINEIDFFDKIDIKKSNFETDKTWFDSRDEHHTVNWKDVYEINSYENSFINIVTESCYERHEIHITEKSVKPFYFFQLPIFLSSHNHVKYLRDRFNFDMFDDLINHEYDNEFDNRKRLKMVFNEIKRLNDNKEFVIEFYSKNKERFVENQKKVILIYNSKNDTNYFNQLINKKI